MSFKNLSKIKVLILLLLKDIGAATTEELIKEAEMLGIVECSDRVPSAIADLNSEGFLNKTFSRGKKAIIWSLSNSVDSNKLA